MAEENYQVPPSEGKKNYNYGKRPLWQWIVLYVIVGAVAYGAAYYFFFSKSGGYGNRSNNYMIQNMKVEILKNGSGSAAQPGDRVTVNYVGTLENGVKFDSSIDRGTPFQFILGQNRVIQGWELGVSGMKVGEKRKLTIPSELAYGNTGAGTLIPPNATLIFEIELLKIN